VAPGFQHGQQQRQHRQDDYGRRLMRGHGFLLCYDRSVDAEQKDDLKTRVKRIQEELKQYIQPGDRLLSEELIEERRQESARENAK
jgi:hypothetical protein